MKKAVCIISGGMDSALCAYIAKLKDKNEVIALHFNYNQRTQDKEKKAFNDICDDLRVLKWYEFDLDFFSQIGASALVDKTIQLKTTACKSGEVPNTYVPYRNGIFISIATALAEKEGAQSLYLGVMEEDSSGYPDCTQKFITSCEKTINHGTKKSTKLKIVTPIVHLSKSDIVKKALELNVPLELTWSCYQDNEKACGVCDSCRLRLKGFKQANLKDKIKYA